MNGYWKVPLVAVAILIAVCLLLGFHVWLDPDVKWAWESSAAAQEQSRGACPPATELLPLPPPRPGEAPPWASPLPAITDPWNLRQSAFSAYGWVPMEMELRYCPKCEGWEVGMVTVRRNNLVMATFGPGTEAQSGKCLVALDKARGGDGFVSQWTNLGEPGE